MATKRSKPNPDPIICANIHGAASKHVPWHDPAGEARKAAIAELLECVTHDRTVRYDLLSRECGLFRGLAAESSGCGGWAS